MNKKIYCLLFLIGFVPPLIHAQSNPNNLQLRVDAAYFSPNNDGLQDQLFFQPIMQSQVNVKSWNLDIFQAKNRRRVARLSGRGFPALIKWDGLDRKGLRVEEGAYLAQMTAVSKPKINSAEQTFWVDTEPPQVEISLSTNILDQSFLEKSNVIFTPTVNDASPIDQWLFQVVGQGGHSAFVFWSSGPVTNVEWDGKDRTSKVFVAQGDYRVIFQAWDRAGNESVPAFADFEAKVSPREMLGHSLREIKINETPLGLIVQLESRALFRLVKGKLELSEYGKNSLREVAILINAYPEVSVKLDGYSRSFKDSSQDRDRASIYAWKVYSYLTKIGNVKPSRLNVRGRGRSAMFDRRSVGVPLLKDGVEVLLEGNRSW